MGFAGDDFPRGMEALVDPRHVLPDTAMLRDLYVDRAGVAVEVQATIRALMAQD